MRLRFPGIFLGILAVSASASFLSAEDAPVIGALKGPSGIALIQLFENPPRLSDGRIARMEAVSSADLMVAKLVSGECQVAVLPVNMAAKLRTSGLDVTLGAITGNGMLEFLTNASDISTLADLRGRRVDVSGQGATPEYLFRRLLRDAGLDPDKDLRLSFTLTYSEMAAALAGGRIESALLPEPFATLARMKNPGLRAPFDIRDLWKASTGMPDYPMTVLVFRDGSSIPRSDARIILDAVRDSIAATVKNPVAAGVLVEKYGLGLPRAVAVAAIPRCNFVFLESKEARPEVEAILREFLSSAPDSIGGRLPDDGFYADY